MKTITFDAVAWSQFEFWFDRGVGKGWISDETLIEAYENLWPTVEQTALSDEDIEGCLPLGLAPFSTLCGPREILAFARKVEQKVKREE